MENEGFKMCSNRTAASQLPALSYRYTDGVAFVLTLRLVGS